jgi:hypothetical protein
MVRNSSYDFRFSTLNRIRPSVEFGPTGIPNSSDPLPPQGSQAHRHPKKPGSLTSLGSQAHRHSKKPGSLTSLVATPRSQAHCHPSEAGPTVSPRKPELLSPKKALPTACLPESQTHCHPKDIRPRPTAFSMTLAFTCMDILLYLYIYVYVHMADLIEWKKRSFTLMGGGGQKRFIDDYVLQPTDCTQVIRYSCSCILHKKNKNT